MTRDQIYAATDPTYASCLVCQVNPIRWCDACDERLCSAHAKKLVGMWHCPICYAMQLVNQRDRILDVLRKYQEKISG